MTDYDNTNKGAIFKNDRKEKETHPDMKGSLNVGGVDYWVSAWTKNGKGGKFLSLSVTVKDESAKPSRPDPAQASASADPFGDDLPF